MGVANVIEIKWRTGEIIARELKNFRGARNCEIIII